MSSQEPPATPTEEPQQPPAEEQPSAGRGDGSQGRGRGQGRGQGRGRGNGRGGGRGQQGRGQQQQGRGQGGPVSIAPASGIPYGHVPGYLPGSSSLVEELDQRLLMVLRDGRQLVGILRSFDQFSNMVLEDASERKMHHHSDGVTYYADVPLGVYVIRGDSIVLMGQVSSDEHMKELQMPELDEIMEASNLEKLEWDFDKDLLA